MTRRREKRRDASTGPRPRGLKETPVLRQIRVALGKLPGVWIWRNNVGVDVRKGIRYGLGVGSADLVGVVAPYGRFIALEVKREIGGVVSDDQRVWLGLITAAGGVARVVRSVREAMLAVEEARNPW